MTKDAYFEMCEMLGTEPKDEDIPIEMSDFPEEIQTVFEIYHMLRDHWEGMSGTYMGKDLSSIQTIFEIYDVSIHERKLYLEYISVIDIERMSVMEAKRKQEESLKAK